MRINNNTFAGLCVFLVIISLYTTMITINEINTINKKSTQPTITGKLNDIGQVKVCFNSPPEFIGHNCTGPIYVGKNGRVIGNYSCVIQAIDWNNQTISYYVINSSFATINNTTGKLIISGNISNGNSSNPPENITIRLTITDGSICSNNEIQINIVIDQIILRGGIILLQNYTSNTTNYIIHKEGFTTFHKSLDEYFLDLEGNPLKYNYNYFDLQCFNIIIGIDNETNMVVYTSKKGFNTDITGPCRAQFIASNADGFKNETNIFYIYVEKAPPPPPPPPPPSGGGGGGGGRGGGSGGGSGGGTSNNPYLYDNCTLLNVSCSEWGECKYRPPYYNLFNVTYNYTNDGIQKRSCTWTTNCPDKMKPQMNNLCMYMPTCSDGLMNCKKELNNKTGELTKFCEEGIDCGGPCSTCPSCSDWIQNDKEEGIDCGGLCEPCATCSDNKTGCIKTSDHLLLCENSIDCGGFCLPCAVCKNGKKGCRLLESGEYLCEEGLNCVGECPPCPKIDSPSRILGDKLKVTPLLITIVIIIGAIYPVFILTKMVGSFIVVRRMKKIKARILKERNEYLHDYLAHFERQINLLSDDFDSVTAQISKDTGDDLLLRDDSTGYNLDRYSVSFENDYADVLKDSSITTVNYAVYMNNIEHGKKILDIIAQSGIFANYKLCKRSSSVLTDREWKHSDGVKYEIKNGRMIARSVEYIISFMPKDQEETERLIKLLEQYGEGTQPDKLTGAWDIPDIRVTGTQPILDYDKSILNSKSIGGQQILVLTKEKPLDGFDHTEIWVNPQLSKFIK